MGKGNFLIILFILLFSLTALAIDECVDEIDSGTSCMITSPKISCSTYDLYNTTDELQTDDGTMTQLSSTGVYNFTFSETVIGRYIILLCSNDTAYLNVVSVSDKTRLKNIDSNVTEIQANQSNFVTADLSGVLGGIQNNATDIKENVSSQIDTVDSTLSNIQTDIENNFTTIQANFDVVSAGIQDNATDVKSNVSDQIDTIDSALSTVQTNLDTNFSQIYERFGHLDTNLTEVDTTLSNINTYLDTNFTQIYTRFTTVDTSLDTNFTEIQSDFDILISGIQTNTTFLDSLLALNFTKIYSKFDILITGMSTNTTWLASNVQATTNATQIWNFNVTTYNTTSDLDSAGSYLKAIEEYGYG